MPNGMSVDQLNIEITASAKTANTAIDNLCRKLDLLSKSVSSLNSVNINNITKTFGSLSKTLSNNSLSGGAKSIASLNRSFVNLGKMDTSQIGNAKNALNELRKSLELFENIKFGDALSQIAGFNRSVASLGGKSALQAVENIPKLAKAMNELMATLSKAPTVNQNLIDMTNALARLAKTGSSSGKAVNSLSGMFDRTKKKSFSLASAIGKMYASYWLLFRAFGKIKDAIDISAKLTEVQNVVDVTFGKQRNLVEEMSKTSITDYGMSELTVKEVSSRFQAMGSAMGITNKQVASTSEFLAEKGVSAYGKLGDSMGNVSVNLTKLAADMASFYNVEQKDVAEDLESVFTGASRPLREYGLDLTQATLKEFALKNGLDANIESMSQAEKTMLRYQYVMANTGAAQGDFAKTALTWSNQVRILKQNFEQLGSIFGGVLINAFKPVVIALNNVIGKFIEFAKVVSDSLGKIFGWTYNAGSSGGVTSDLEAGADASEGISDGMGSAADNAKKLRQQLQGFDELNVLSSNDSTGGGSSGGSGGAGTGSAENTGGEWVKTESLMDQFESELDTLYELGEYISETLTKALEDIDWENIYESARDFGTGLAEFLNGLISPELFSALGKTVAGAINTAFNAVNAFSIEFEWEELGKSMAESIDVFFKTWDAELTGETFENMVGGIYRGFEAAFDTIVENETAETIGQKIVDLVCSVNWGGLVWDLHNFFTGLNKAVMKAPYEMVEGIIEAIIEKLTGKEVEIDMPFVFGADSIIDILQIAVNKAKDWWNNNKPSLEKIEVKIDNIKELIKEKIAAAKEWWNNNNIFTSISIVVSSIVEKLKSAVNAAKEWWKNNKPSFENVIIKIESIKELLKEKLDSAKAYWKKNKAFTAISVTISSIKDKLRSEVNKVKDWWKKNKPSLSAITAKIKIPRLVVTWDTTGFAAKALQKLGLKGFPDFDVRYYAAGGFPEDGWFRANHGELMGRFDNGRTVVANNKQITAGIAEAVYQGNRENNSIMRQELELMRRQNDLLMELVEKETGISPREIFDSVKRTAEEYKRRTGRPAFSY